MSEVEATSPATGGVLGTVPSGDAEGRRAASDRLRERGLRAVTGPRSAFERVSIGARGELVAERRDDLARTLTLDQGKPLHAEAATKSTKLVAYWRMAAADATRVAGALPPSVDSAKRILQYRVPRRGRRSRHALELAVHDATEVIAPALAANAQSCGYLLRRLPSAR